jgi:hypothetical protein
LCFALQTSRIKTVTQGNIVKMTGNLADVVCCVVVGGLENVHRFVEYH